MSFDGRMGRHCMLLVLAIAAAGCGEGAGTVDNGATASAVSGATMAVSDAGTATAAGESCTLAALSPSNTASQNAAALSTAITTSLSQGGRVCLPGGSSPYPWQTYTLSVGGISIIGQEPVQTYLYNQPGEGYRLTGGTVLKGSGAGSGAAFQYIGPGGAARTWGTGYLSTFTIENVGFDSWDKAVLFGGPTKQGCAYCTFKNLYATNIGVRGYEFINMQSDWLENINGYFAGSGMRFADDIDSATYGTTSNSTINQVNITFTGFASEGLVLEATNAGTTGSGLNEIEIQYVLLEHFSDGCVTAAGTPSSGGSSNITLSGGSAGSFETVGLPLTVTTSSNGLTAGQTYFVTSVAGNVIHIADYYGDPTAKTFSSATSLALKSCGGVNFALRGLTPAAANPGVVSGIQAQGIDSEGYSTAAIYLQGATSNYVSILSVPAVAYTDGVVLRYAENNSFNSIVQVNRDEDAHVGSGNFWTGVYNTDVNSSAAGFIGSQYNQGANNAKLGLTSNPAGTGTPGSGIEVYSGASGGNLFYPDDPMGQYTGFIGASSGTLYNVWAGNTAYPNGTGSMTLPAVTSSNIGLPYNIHNDGNGVLSIATSSSQTFNDLSGQTSVAVPAGATLDISAVQDGGRSTKYWQVQSVVAPYEWLELGTPTISSGFGGTSPSVTAGGTAHSFSVNVGSGKMTSSGVIGLPKSAHGWACTINDVTTPAENSTVQTGSSASSATVTNFARTTGLAANWPANDILESSCFPN